MTALTVSHQLQQRGAHCLQFSGHRLAIQGRQVVFEIHPRLELRQLIEQAQAQGADLPLETTIETRHRQLGRSPAAGRHQLTDGLSAGEIQPAVEKSPLAEFTGQGAPGTGGQHQLQHPLHRDQPAVAVQLNDGLAGEAAGRAHQEQQRFIHPLAAAGIAHMAVEHAVALPDLLAGRLKQTRSNGFGLGPGDAHDRHAALTGGDGGGDSSDRVGGHASSVSFRCVSSC